jgi:hypothetical protein
MRHKAHWHILLALLGVFPLTSAQDLSSVANITFSFTPNTTTTTNSSGSVVVVTAFPAQETVNSTTIGYQYPNSTTTSRTAATTPNVITTSADAQVSVLTSANPSVQNAATEYHVSLMMIVVVNLLLVFRMRVSFGRAT